MADTTTPIIATTAPTRWQTLASIGRGLFNLAVIIGVGILVYDRVYPATPPGIGTHGITLGKAYALKLPFAAADGWDAIAGAVEKGGTMADAKTAYDAAYQTEFVKSVAPEFAKILPEGMEPTSPAQRSAFAGLARDFAHGLRGGK